MVIPIEIDPEKQTVTITMDGYNDLMKYYQVGYNHFKNEEKKDIKEISDLSVLRVLYDAAKADYAEAGRSDNPSKYNKAQDTGAAIYNQMKRMLDIFIIPSLQRYAKDFIK